MLSYDDPITIRERTIYRDNEIKNKFYLTGEPVYRQNKYGQPKIALIKYRWSVDWPGNIGGGLLVFDVLLQPPKIERKYILSELQHVLTNEHNNNISSIEVTLMPYSGGEVAISIPFNNLDDSLKNTLLHLKVDPEDNYAVSVAQPLSVKAVTALENALNTQPVVGITYDLKVLGWNNGEVIEKAVHPQAKLLPLEAMRDITGRIQYVDAFVEELEIGNDRFFLPLDIKVVLHASNDNLAISHITFYIEPEDGKINSYKLSPKDETQRIVIHRTRNSWRYRYWYEIYYTNNEKIHKTTPTTTEKGIIVIQLT